jgi:hypothetical protein
MNILSIWPTTVEGWVGLVVLIAGLIGALLKLIPTLIQVHKLTVEAIKQKNIEKLKKVASAAMTGVQASMKSGAEKKEIVMSAVEAAAKEMNVEIDKEALIELSNHIDSMKTYYNTVKESDELKGE